MREDGTEFDVMEHKEQYGRLPSRRIGDSWSLHFRKTYHVNYGEPGTFRWPLDERTKAMVQLWYVSRTYQPWVQEVSNGPEPVTLEITDNIVKWEGELPGEIPDEVP